MSASFNKSCTKASDCFLAEHWAGCCRLNAVGLNYIEMPRFLDFEAKCGGPPPCGCCCDRVFTEDGMMLAPTANVGVDCVAGACVTKGL
jgi:hypothetical protein